MAAKKAAPAKARTYTKREAFAKMAADGVVMQSSNGDLFGYCSRGGLLYLGWKSLVDEPLINDSAWREARPPFVVFAKETP